MNFPPKLTTSTPKVGWTIEQSDEKYTVTHPTGASICSTIEIQKGTRYQSTADGSRKENGEYRHGIINLFGTAERNGHIYKGIATVCSKGNNLQFSPGGTKTYWVFTIEKYEEVKKFLSCLSLINKYYPFKHDALATMSKLSLGYAVKCDTEVSLAPMFAFAMAMGQDTHFPSDVTKHICALFLNNVLEFDTNFSKNFYQDVVVKALKEPTLKNVASYEYPPMPIDAACFSKRKTNDTCAIF